MFRLRQSETAQLNALKSPTYKAIHQSSTRERTESINDSFARTMHKAFSAQSSLALRETILGVLKARDLDGSGIIHTSDFKAALLEFSLPMGSQEVEDILIHCKISMDGSIDFSKLEKELRLERQVYNNRPKTTSTTHLKTSQGTQETALRVDDARKGKVIHERQPQLVYAHRSEIHEIYKKFSHGEKGVDATIESLHSIGIEPTKAFNSLIRQNASNGGTLPYITFAEFTRALSVVDSSSNDVNDSPAGGSKYEDSERYKSGSDELDRELFQSRKRIDHSVRSRLQKTTTTDQDVHKNVKKLFLEINEDGEERTKFRSSNATGRLIFFQENCVASLLSQSQLSMQTGALGQEISIKYTSEQKFLREQVLAAMRKLDANSITLEEFIEKVNEIGFVLPEELMNELKRTHYGGKINWKRCVSLLDANFFKAKALLESTGPNTVADAKEKIVNALKQNGHESLTNLCIKFKKLITPTKPFLTLNEFRKGWADYGTSNLTDEDLRCIYNAFDLNGDGKLSVDEFARGIRGDLHSACKKYVRFAYSKIDLADDEKVSILDLLNLANTAYHPDVRRGLCTDRQAVSYLSVAFDQTNYYAEDRNNSGFITYQMFESYFANLATFIESDENFVEMMKGMWSLGDHLPPQHLKKSKNSDTKNPLAIQSNGDIIIWRQQQSILENIGEKLLRDQKKMVKNTAHKPGKFDLAFVSSYGKGKKVSQEEIDEAGRDEWKLVLENHRRLVAPPRESEMKDSIIWDTSNSAVTDAAAVRNAQISSTTASSSSSSSSSSNNQLTGNEDKEINHQGRKIHKDLFGTAPYGTDTSVGESRSKRQNQPKPLSSVIDPSNGKNQETIFSMANTITDQSQKRGAMSLSNALKKQ